MRHHEQNRNAFREQETGCNRRNWLRCSPLQPVSCSLKAFPLLMTHNQHSIKKLAATNCAASAAAAATEKCQVFGVGIRGIFEGP